jgi:hypothetical protein
MTIEAFKSSIEEKNPPEDLDQMLLALWYDAKGEWEKSHAIVQDIDTREAALIHAYLHRKEGDIGNADYWYHRAGTKRAHHSTEDEWTSLVGRFLPSSDTH